MVFRSYSLRTVLIITPIIGFALGLVGKYFLGQQAVTAAIGKETMARDTLEKEGWIVEGGRKAGRPTIGNGWAVTGVALPDKNVTISNEGMVWNRKLPRGRVSLDVLKSLQYLSAIDVSYSDFGDSDLGDWRGVRVASFFANGCEITDASANLWAGFTISSEIGLNETGIGTRTLEQIYRSQKIESLHVRDCSDVNDEGLGWISKMPLKVVDLSNVGATWDEIAATVKKLMALEVLTISCSPGDEESLCELCEGLSLRTLLINCKVSDQYQARLRRCAKNRVRFLRG